VTGCSTWNMVRSATMPPKSRRFLEKQEVAPGARLSRALSVLLANALLPMACSTWNMIEPHSPSIGRSATAGGCRCIIGGSELDPFARHDAGRGRLDRLLRSLSLRGSVRSDTYSLGNMSTLWLSPTYAGVGFPVLDSTTDFPAYELRLLQHQGPSRP